MRIFLRNLSLLSLLLAGSHLLLAQATAAGNIVGVVTDATGAALPNVTVTATNTGTNAQRTTTSGTSGSISLRSSARRRLQHQSGVKRLQPHRSKRYPIARRNHNHRESSHEDRNHLDLG